MEFFRMNNIEKFIAETVFAKKKPFFLLKSCIHSLEQSLSVLILRTIIEHIPYG